MTQDIDSASAKPVVVRLDFMDALRGLAAMYVMVYHMVMIPDPHLALPHWFQVVAHDGGMGVTLFFVVSAFSLFYTMPLRLREPRPWVSFFLHRFFRIAPLFYAWIVLTLIRDHLKFGVDHGLREIAESASFLFNLLPQQQQGFVWASWTIGVEMLFYATFPLFYSYARNRWQALTVTLWLLIGWTAIKGLLVYLPGDPASQQAFVQWSFLRHLPVFACGALAYHLFLPQGKKLDRSRDLGIAMIATAAFLYVALVNNWLPSLFGDLYYWQALIFLLLLLGLGWAPVKSLVNRFTIYMGRISYSLYLSHPTIILLLFPVYAWIYKRGVTNTTAIVACLMITFSAAIVVSELTYRLIEKPGIQLGRRLNTALRKTWTAGQA